MAEADQCTCSGLRPEPGTNAIVGGGVPLAAGNAWAQRHDAEVHDDGGLASGMGVTVTYFGDGASNIGSTLETLNLAAAWRLPLCFYIENNLYAVSTHVADVTGGTSAGGSWARLRHQVLAGGRHGSPPCGLPCPDAAVEHMRAGKGATLIELRHTAISTRTGPSRGGARSDIAPRRRRSSGVIVIPWPNWPQR